jgi:hypothetical protein
MYFHPESRKIVDYIIKTRSDSFCAKSNIEDPNEVEVDNWAKHKKTFYYIFGYFVHL